MYRTENLEREKLFTDNTEINVLLSQYQVDYLLSGSCTTNYAVMSDYYKYPRDLLYRVQNNENLFYVFK